MSEILIKTRYNTIKQPGIKFPEKGKTQQQFETQTNINNIVARYRKTGVLGNPLAPNMRQAVFGDFSSGADYQSVCNRIINAQNEFMGLKPELRARFGNDVGQLVDFMSKPENRKECVELGLLPKSVLPVPPETPRNFNNKEDNDAKNAQVTPKP